MRLRDGFEHPLALLRPPPDRCRRLAAEQSLRARVCPQDKNAQLLITTINAEPAESAETLDAGSRATGRMGSAAEQTTVGLHASFVSLPPHNGRRPAWQADRVERVSHSVAPNVSAKLCVLCVESGDKRQEAIVRPYSIASASARQLASIMLALAPTVVHRSVPLCVSIRTRVTALVPSVPFRIRTL